MAKPSVNSQPSILLTQEQRYWSLHGTFEAYRVLISKLSAGEFSSPQILKDELLRGMQEINQLMVKLEKEVPNITQTPLKDNVH